MIKAILLVGAGSFAGGVLRFIVSILMQGKWAPKDFPYHTLAVNVIGCAAIGVVFALMNRAGAGEGIRLFAITGVLADSLLFQLFHSIFSVWYNPGILFRRLFTSSQALSWDFVPRMLHINWLLFNPDKCSAAYIGAV